MNNIKELRRKIQIVGGNTVTVSLPSSWVKKHNIGKKDGNQHEVIMKSLADGTLVLTPADFNVNLHDRIRIHQISTRTTSNELIRILAADYMGGIDKIILKIKKPLNTEILREIQEFVQSRLIGFDLSNLENQIEIVSMFQAPKYDMVRLLQIVEMRSLKMISSCYTWIKEDVSDYDALLANMYDWEITIDRQTNQMIRTLQISLFDFWTSEKVNLPMSELLYWFAVIKAIESACDLAVAITELALNHVDWSDNLRNELFKLGNNVENLFTNSLEAYTAKKPEIAHQVLNDQRTISISLHRKWPISSTDKLDGTSSLILRHLEKIGTYARKIAEATLNRDAAAHFDIE